MNTFFDHVQHGLVWLPELGMGHYPVSEEGRPYNADYFSRFQKMADTPVGRALTEARIRLVARHYSGPVLDVGIGAGHFVASRPGTYGYDINPEGIKWLEECNKWQDLYAESCPALTFWDSLEHIDRPDYAIASAQQWVFVSIPVFDNAEHILRSRHFRKTEHIWYWTHDGFINWFDAQGFTLTEFNTIECDFGRNGIGSYAFKRRGNSQR